MGGSGGAKPPLRNLRYPCLAPGGLWGDGAVLIISKDLRLKGKFFEMVSWGGLGGLAPLRNLRYPCLAPRGGSGGLRPLRNLRYPCLAPAATMPCPRALPPIYAYDHKIFWNFFAFDFRAINFDMTFDMFLDCRVTSSGSLPVAVDTSLARKRENPSMGKRSNQKRKK